MQILVLDINKTNIYNKYKLNNQLKTQHKDKTNPMQNKRKLKSKKTSEIFTEINEPLNQTATQSYEFIEVGGMCGDGTFTQNTGRGAGSHHNGIRYKLYARRSEIGPPEKCLTSKSTTTSSNISLKPQQNSTSKSNNQPHLTSPLSIKKKTKKISLKQTFKTKAKRQILYEKLHQIFEILYKDDLPIVEEQLDDGLWLVVASVCDLYQQLEESTELIREFEDRIGQQVKNQQFQQMKSQKNDIEALQLQVKTLKKDNQSLIKQIQKISKKNTQLTEQLSQNKFRQRNFKKICRLIQKKNPKILTQALQQSKLDTNALKKHKQPQNRVTTRSMLKKQQSKAQDNKKESLFSSDQDVDFFDEQNTIVGLIRGMK